MNCGKVEVEMAVEKVLVKVLVGVDTSTTGGGDAMTMHSTPMATKLPWIRLIGTCLTPFNVSNWVFLEGFDDLFKTLCLG